MSYRNCSASLFESDLSIGKWPSLVQQVRQSTPIQTIFRIFLVDSHSNRFSSTNNDAVLSSSRAATYKKLRLYSSNL